LNIKDGRGLRHSEAPADCDPELDVCEEFVFSPARGCKANVRHATRIHRFVRNLTAAAPQNRDHGAGASRGFP
jgi:hypothetical protein